MTRKTNSTTLHFKDGILVRVSSIPKASLKGGTSTIRGGSEKNIFLKKKKVNK